MKCTDKILVNIFNHKIKEKDDPRLKSIKSDNLFNLTVVEFGNASIVVFDNVAEFDN